MPHLVELLRPVRGRRRWRSGAMWRLMRQPHRLAPPGAAQRPAAALMLREPRRGGRWERHASYGELSGSRIDARAGLLASVEPLQPVRAESALQLVSYMTLAAFLRLPLRGHRARIASISGLCDCSRIRCRCAQSRNRRARSCRTEHSQWTNSKLN